MGNPTKLAADNQIILDAPLLKVPLELIRRNFKTAQRTIDKETKAITASINEAAAKAQQGTTSPEETITAISAMIDRMNKLKRKLEDLQVEEDLWLHRSKVRIAHTAELFQCHTLEDVRFEKWNEQRLDRLLVDYMLRKGMTESSIQLAQQKDIKDLVDVEVFTQCRKIEQALLNESVTECLSWWNDNKTALSKINSNLEFELRIQEYIEMVRGGQQLPAIAYYRKHLVPFATTHRDEIHRAAALLAFPQDTEVQPYKNMYARDSWQNLASSFVLAHHTLHNVPAAPLLHIALSAGLSALKTPSCYSNVPRPPINFYSDVPTGLCPICSPELNALARNVPYAQHVRNIVDDPVALPNGRVYSQTNLEAWGIKQGVSSGKVRDPLTLEEWDVGALRKVYVM